MEIVYIPGFDFAKGFEVLLVVNRSGKNMGQLNLSGVAIFLGLDHRNQIQAQQSQVVQVVMSKGFTAQMRMDETEPPESSCSSAKPPYVGKLQVRCISENHISDNSVARDQDTDLAPKLSGKRG
jgi:hypothetical protein